MDIDEVESEDKNSNILEHVEQILQENYDQTWKE